MSQKALLFVVLLGFAAAGSLSCSRKEADGAEARAVPAPYKSAWTPPEVDGSTWRLEGTVFHTEREAIEAVLSLCAGKGTMQEFLPMVFNRREYVTYLYPQTSCADPVRNTPAEFVWKQHWLNVASGMKRCLGAWRGRTLTYVSHRFTKPDQTYGPLTLRRELVVTVTDEKGERNELRPFRDLIRLNGTYKVFSFHT